MRKFFSGLSSNQKAITVCAVLFLIMMFAALMVNIVRQGELSKRQRQLQAEITQLQQEKALNEEQLAALNSQDFADAYAREELDLKKKGEKAYKGEE